MNFAILVFDDVEELDYWHSPTPLPVPILQARRSFIRNDPSATRYGGYENDSRAPAYRKRPL